MPTHKLLLAEDDPAISELLTHHFVRESFQTILAEDGLSALRLAREGVDLLVLDIGLPGIDGLEVTRTLRREGRTTPILMLTARTEEIDRILGLELGADDYVVKPFSPREVVSRVRAILRRAGMSGESAPRMLRFGRLEIDEGAREARIDGADTGIKPREFALLLALVRNMGVAVSRTQLLERVWGYDFEGDERTLDVHIRRLRQKIEEYGKLTPCIITVHGYGYKFIAPG